MLQQNARPSLSEICSQNFCTCFSCPRDSPCPSTENVFKTEDRRLPSWYWGNIARSDADERLKDLRTGSFLIRDSTTAGDYTLIVRKDGQNRRMKIFCAGRMYGLKLADCRFKSLRELVQYYNRHSLAEFNRRVTTCLLYPVRRPRFRIVDVYEALGLLADKGRELHEARGYYVVLLSQEKTVSTALRVSKMKHQAYLNALDMVGALIMSPDVGDDELEFKKRLAPVQKAMLDGNITQASRLQRVFKEQSDAAAYTAGLLEKQLNEVLGAINEHGTKLMDIEESCVLVKEQLLNCGLKPGIMECVLDHGDSWEKSWDTPLWLLDCSREEAVCRLAGMEIGTFLIRPKDEQDIAYALSIVCNNDGSPPDVKHCAVYHPEGRGYGFRPDASVFASIDELVFRHAHTSIKVYFPHMDTCLAYPVFLGKSRTNSCEESDPKD